MATYIFFIFYVRCDNRRERVNSPISIHNESNEARYLEQTIYFEFLCSDTPKTTNPFILLLFIWSLCAVFVLATVFRCPQMKQKRRSICAVDSTRQRVRTTVYNEHNEKKGRTSSECGKMINTNINFS